MYSIFANEKRVNGAVLAGVCGRNENGETHAELCGKKSAKICPAQPDL